MVLLLVFMQLTRDLFAIAKFLLFTELGHDALWLFALLRLRNLYIMRPCMSGYICCFLCCAL